MKNSQFMDKQIMNLSNPQGVTDGEENSFMDFVNRPSEKKEDILASYDFMPTRQALGSTSPAVLGAVSSDVDAAEVDSARRTWNSLDSKTDALSHRSYNVLDADESAKFNLQKNKNIDLPFNMSLVSEIDKILKKNMENVTHSIDTMSARLSQLETRTRNLESSIDDLKGSLHNKHGSTDGRMRLLENILNEVRSDVGFIKDKHEIMEAQLRIAKVQFPPLEKDDSHSNVQLPQAPQPPPPPHQNFQLQSQPPTRESYFPSNQTPENPTQPYQVPTAQAQAQPQLQSAPFPQQQQQYQSPPPQPQYTQQPLPAQPPPSLPHQSYSTPNPSMFVQPPDEAPYIPSKTYQIGMHPQSSQQSLSGVPHPPPPQQSYGSTSQNPYYPSSIRPAPRYSGQFGQPAGTGEAYPNQYSSNSQSQYGSSSHINNPQQQHTSVYPQLPTVRILPEASPGSSGSGGSGNKVSTDDVVERVTSMGFQRDQVRATVKKLNEDGQAIDLNIVLDKLMNSGDVQAPRGWFGR